MLVELVERRVDEDRRRSKHDDGGDRDRDLLGPGSQQRLSGHHCSGSTDRIPGADQHRSRSIQAKQPGAQEQRQREGRAQEHGVDQHTAHAHLPDVMQREPQAVKNDARTQQGLLGKSNSRAAACGKEGIYGVAQQDPQHDGDRERGHSVGWQPAGCAQSDSDRRKDRA